MSNELTTIERVKLENYEEIIGRGQQTFLEVGRALSSIRDEKLYRAQHKTFQDYCQERWGYSQQYATQICRSAEVVERIEKSETVVSLPQTERQARPLTKLPPDEQSSAWSEAVATAPNGKVTGQHVEDVVSRRQEAAKPKPDRKHPAKIEAMLERAKEFDERCRQIESVSHWADSIAQDAAGSALMLSDLTASLDAAKKIIRSAKPTAVCKCNGKGCDWCGDIGMLFGPKKSPAV